MADLPPIVDLRQSATALRVQRGVMRMLRERHDMACYAEVPLANGRRADVLAVAVGEGAGRVLQMAVARGADPITLGRAVGAAPGSAEGRTTAAAP